jgi:transposase-like protein
VTAGGCDAMRRNATHPDLSPKQLKAVESLLATGEVSAAAKEVGVNRATLYRWLGEPAFMEAVREAESRALDDLSRLLVRLGRTAAATLAKAMNDPAAPYATRVTAANASLSRLLQLRELATLEARVRALEAAAGLDEAG